MNVDHDETPTPRPIWQRLLLVAAALIILVAAVLAGRWLALLKGGPSEPAKPVAATAAAPPGPATAPTPASALEPARDARPRAKKVEPTPAPAPEVAPAAPTTGELHIDADVPGAMVFLNRKYLGNTPVTAKDLPPGRHHLNLTAEGFDGYSEDVDVAAGPADVLVRFKEVRLKAAVDVVHKHAMGSCEGRLLADPDGIRYETSNKDDAFSMRFADVETFEVDYLKKNLRIKKRGGKSYNFTTKAATADPLFVFHRDVDKVRQQVVGGK